LQGKTSGTTGKSKRLEALSIRLTGELASYYDIYYRVHLQNVGWLAWVKNGTQTGSIAQGLRLEALQILMVPKGAAVPSNNFANAQTVSGAPRLIDASVIAHALAYSATVHLQNKGDVTYGNKVSGATQIGTTGKRLRMEAIHLKLPLDAPYKGGIEYAAHVQNLGWQKAVQDGKMSGTKGRSLRLEAVTIKLTGDMAAHYDVYYCAHVQNIGWTGWAKNGQQCGSAGYSYRMEALQLVIIPKGQAAPGQTVHYFYRP
jgi:uncharacterized protein YjdB